MRRKYQPSAPELREELAEEWDHHAGSWSCSPDFAHVATAARQRAAAIRAGEAVWLNGWEITAQHRGGFDINAGLILGEDDVLRLDDGSWIKSLGPVRPYRADGDGH